MPDLAALLSSSKALCLFSDNIFEKVRNCNLYRLQIPISCKMRSHKAMQEVLGCILTAFARLFATNNSVMDGNLMHLLSLLGSK